MENKINQFISSFCHWGYRDIAKLIEEADQAGKDVDWCIDAIEEFKDSCDINSYKDIDPVYCIYDALHQEARSDIEEATGKDICNDKPYYDISVIGNYMCTSFDGNQESMNALKDLIDTMEEKTKAVEWLYDQLPYVVL